MAFLQMEYLDEDSIVAEVKNASTLPTIASGATGHVLFTITKTGYTFLGILGFSGSSNSGLVLCESNFYADGTNTKWDLCFKNTTNSSVTPTAYKGRFLYVKNH